MSCYLDVAALRRILWCAAAYTWPTPCRAVDAGGWWHPLLFVWAALLLEAVSLAVPASYVSFRVCPPALQLPPVTRTSRNPRHRVTFIAAVAANTWAVSSLWCTPLPNKALAVLVGLHACLVVLPSFGRPSFWKLHYWGVYALSAVRWCGFETGEDEEWFCTAEMAARAVMASLPAAGRSSHVLVVGNGLSGLPGILAEHFARVTAIDASYAAVATMRRRCARVRWRTADLTSLDRHQFASGSCDVLVDKGTYAALLEKSVRAWAAGFAEAYRLLRPGGVVITVALIALPASRFAAVGFELRSSYRLPPYGKPGCPVFPRAFVQVLVKRGHPATSSDAHSPEHALCGGAADLGLELELDETPMVMSFEEYDATDDAADLPLLPAPMTSIRQDEML